MALLVRLIDEITEKWSEMKKIEVIFHQDNTPCHHSLKTMAKQSVLSFEFP